MVVAMALLLYDLSQVPPIQLLPGYAAAYLLIGACIFGPVGKVSLRQAAAFVLPGALLAVLALMNMGFWAGGWLLGLPAWGLLLSRWTPENPLRLLQVLKFLGLVVLGLVIFSFNGVYPIPSLGLFVLPIIPLIGLAYPGPAAKGCRQGSLRCGHSPSCLRGSHPGRRMDNALDPCRRRRHRRTHDCVLGQGPSPSLPAGKDQQRGHRLGLA